MKKVDINELLGATVSIHGNPHIKAKVIENLRLLIPKGLEVEPEKMNVINFAVAQFCHYTKDTNSIDWVALVGLAADIAKLWQSGFIKS